MHGCRHPGAHGMHSRPPGQNRSTSTTIRSPGWYLALAMGRTRTPATPRLPMSLQILGHDAACARSIAETVHQGMWALWRACFGSPAVLPPPPKNTICVALSVCAGLEEASILRGSVNAPLAEAKSSGSYIHTYIYTNTPLLHSPCRSTLLPTVRELMRSLYLFEPVRSHQNHGRRGREPTRHVGLEQTAAGHRPG